MVWKNEDKGDLSRIFNSRLDDILKFIKHHNIIDNVEVCIPEVVVEERVQQQWGLIQAIITNVESRMDQLNPLGLGYSKPTTHLNLKAYLIKMVDQYMLDNNINKIKIPQIDQVKLLERAFCKIKPFGSAKDNGFKDTVLWLSVLDDVKSNITIDYILCTNNLDDFVLESLCPEFKSISSAKFEIFRNFNDVKEYLDKKYNLKLELGEKFKVIEDEINKKVGTLMRQIDSFRGRRKKDVWYSSADVMFSPVDYSNFPGLFNTKDILKESKGFDFVSLSVDSIVETDDGNVFRVNLKVLVDAEIPNGVYNNDITNYYFTETTKQVYLKTSLDFNYKENTFVVQSVAYDSLGVWPR